MKSGHGHSAPPTFLVMYVDTWFKYEILKKKLKILQKNKKVGVAIVLHPHYQLSM